MKYKKLQLKIVLSLTLAMLVLMFFTVIFIKPGKPGVNYIEDVKTENILKRTKYKINITKSSKCVWETSYFNFRKLKREKTRMYLVPLSATDNRYIGILVDGDGFYDKYLNERSISGNDNYLCGFTGYISDFDIIMSHKISKAIKHTDLDSNAYEILPMYLSEGKADSDVLFIEIIWVAVLGYIICSALFSTTKRPTSDPIRTTVIFEKDSDRRIRWDDMMERMEIRKSKFSRILSPYDIGRDGDDKSIYSALVRKNLHELLVFVISVAILAVIYFSIIVSPNPANWYWAFYDDPGFFTIPLTILFAFGVIYLIYRLIKNLIKIKLRLKKQSTYKKDYLDACLSKGRLFASKRGFLYITKTHIIIGDDKLLKMIRCDELKKVEWCIIDEKIGDTNAKILWAVFTNDRGENVGIKIKIETLISSMRYWRNIQLLLKY